MRTLRCCLAVSFFALAGCALFQPRQVEKVPLRDVSRAELFAKLKARQFPRAYRGAVSMQLRFQGARSDTRQVNPLVPRGSFAGHAVLVLRKPDSLRLEPLSPFGTPLMVVVAQGASFRAYSPSRNTVFMGRTNRQGIEQILGIPLNSEIFIKLLLGDWTVALGGEENLDLKKSGSAYRLETRRGAGGVVSSFVDLEPRYFHAVNMELHTLGGAIVVRYGRFIKTGKVWRPSQVEILATGGKNRLHFTYPADDGAVDTALPDNLFRLEPPRGARTVWLGG